MSKMKRQITKGKKAQIRTKFKLGGRKSTRSALQLSTTELKEMASNPSRKKDKTKILNVLKTRK